MAKLMAVNGVLEATGPYRSESSPEPLAFYDWLRFESQDGHEHYLERVFVPAYLDTAVAPGSRGKFFLVTLNYPQLFGSAPISFLFGTEIQGKLRNGLNQAQRCFSVTKRSVVQLFIGGALLMFAFGAGVLLWIQAVRVLRLEMPLAEMKRSMGVTG